MEFKDKKGVENSVADQLSHLQFEESVELHINDYMRDDTLLKASTIDPWYANIVNYIVAGCIPPWVGRKKIILDSILQLWDDPYLYRVCADGLLRRCIPSFETWKILEHCHSSPYGHHYGAFHTNAKCDKVDSTGPLCVMTPSHLFNATSNVRGIEISIQGTYCH
jgi:hypothetical protein